MTWQIRKIYTCDFCNKKMFTVSGMKNHERWCLKHPLNKRICHECEHLEEIEVEYYTENCEGSLTGKTKGFKCNKYDKLLYPLIVEKRGLVDKYPETFEDQEPMKSNCKDYAYKYDYDITGEKYQDLI